MMVPARLREARLKTGLSQKRLGIKARIDEFTAGPRINQYERGTHTPDFRTIERLADVLDVPAPYFYARDNHLADWILAYPKLKPEFRTLILQNIKER